MPNIYDAIYWRNGSLISRGIFGARRGRSHVNILALVAASILSREKRIFLSADVQAAADISGHHH